MERVLPFYSGVHRGTGYKSRLSTGAYEQARDLVGEFVGADPDRDVVVFTKNTTEAINKLARALPIAERSVVLTTLLEHHSNDLPWRTWRRTVRVGVAGRRPGRGRPRPPARQYAGRVALLAVSGASNVTGVVHRCTTGREGARRRRPYPGRRRPAGTAPGDRHAAHDDPGHLDFVALSAHKMYAPFGSGALIGQRDGFA